MYSFAHLSSVSLEHFLRDGIAGLKGMYTLRLFDTSCQNPSFWAVLISPSTSNARSLFPPLYKWEVCETVGAKAWEARMVSSPVRFKKGAVCDLGKLALVPQNPGMLAGAHRGPQWPKGKRKRSKEIT